MSSKKLLSILIALYFLGIASALWLIYSKNLGTAKTSGKGSSVRLVPAHDAIAVIKISGPIRVAQGSQGFITNDAESICAQLRQYEKRADVKAIILRINSPGGSVAATQEIYAEVMKLRSLGKIVVASMADVGASGAYYIASACDRILANPGTLTGSIGVILEFPNVQELFRKIGVRMETVKTGSYKDSGSSYRDITAEERVLFQALVNDAYNQFIDDIIRGRNMTREKLLPLADGRIFTGSQALKAGLIDELGSDQDAIEAAKRLAGIRGTPRIVNESQPLNRLLSMFNEYSSRSPLAGFTEAINNRTVRLEYILE